MTRRTTLTSWSRALSPAALSPAVLALAASVAACRRPAPPADPAAQQLVIGAENITVAHAGSVTNGPAISGSLDAALDATIRAQVAGSVTSTSADLGQTVRRGQVLGRIEATALQDAYFSARAAVASAEAQASVAQRNLQRSQTLLAAGAIAQRDLETAQTQATAATAGLQNARAQLAAASKNYQNATITAPFDGIVSQKSVNVGDVVQPGTALYTVVDPSTMRLQAAVPSDQLGMVHVGDDVTFAVTGIPGREFHGTVRRVSPAVDPTTRQVQIIVSLPNPGRTLVAGLYADGRVSSATRQGIVVPQSAIDTRMQRPAVLKIQNGKVVRVDVTVGMHDPTAETVQVTQGVAAGDTLLVAAAQGISPGTPVRVEGPPADGPASVAGQGGASVATGPGRGNAPVGSSGSATNSSGH